MADSISRTISDTFHYIDHAESNCKTFTSHDIQTLSSCSRNPPECIALIRQGLQGFENRRKENSLDLDERAILEDTQSAKAAAKNLSAISKTNPSPVDTEANDHSENSLQQLNTTQIMAMLHLLQGVHKLVDTHISPPLIDLVHQLEAAIKELKLSQPHIPRGETAGGNHYGTGDNFNNLGNGRQNINKDNGTQYNSGSMTWPSRSNP